MSDIYAPPQSSISGPTPAQKVAKETGLYPVATVGQRIGAAFLEFVVWLPLLGLQALLNNISNTLDVVCMVLYQVIVMLIYVGMVRFFGGTPGKLILGLRVVMLDRTAATWKASLLRYSVYGTLGAVMCTGQVIARLNVANDYMSLDYLSRSMALQAQTPWWVMLVTGLTFVWLVACFISMLTNKQHRTLYDFQAGTVVVSTR